MTKAVSNREIVLLKKCYYCANMVFFTIRPPNTIRVYQCLTHQLVRHLTRSIKSVQNIQQIRIEQSSVHQVKFCVLIEICYSDLTLQKHCIHIRAFIKTGSGSASIPERVKLIQWKSSNSSSYLFSNFFVSHDEYLIWLYVKRYKRTFFL